MSLMHRSGEQSALPPPEAISAFRDLYLLSISAAQLGDYGLAVQELQWCPLIERTGKAAAVLRNLPIVDAEVLRAFRQLLLICEYLVELHLAGAKCPTLWREAGKLSREAYRYLDARSNGRRHQDV